MPVIQHGFLRSTENVYIHNFLVLFGKILFPIILFVGTVGRCYSLRCLEMFLKPFTKCDRIFSNVLIIAVQLLALVSINNSTFILNFVFILGCHMDVLYCSVAFKICFNAILAKDVLTAFTHALQV